MPANLISQHDYLEVKIVAQQYRISDPHVIDQLLCDFSIHIGLLNVLPFKMLPKSPLVSFPQFFLFSIFFQMASFAYMICGNSD